MKVEHLNLGNWKNPKIRLRAESKEDKKKLNDLAHTLLPGIYKVKELTIEWIDLSVDRVAVKDPSDPLDWLTP